MKEFTEALKARILAFPDNTNWMFESHAKAFCQLVDEFAATWLEDELSKLIMDAQERGRKEGFAEAAVLYRDQLASARENSIEQAVEYLTLFGEVQEAFERIKELEAEIDRLNAIINTPLDGLVL